MAQSNLSIALHNRPFQMAGARFAMEKKFALIADEPGLGKALRNDQPVLTPTGYRPIGLLAVGDKVIGSNGQPCNVTGVFPQGKVSTATVRFSDGTEVVCSWDHLWTVTSTRKNKKYLGTHTFTTKEISEAGVLIYEREGTRRRFHIPLLKPVEFTSKPYGFDPYTIGVLIGDGSLTRNPMVSTDHEIIEKIRPYIESIGGTIVLRKEGACGYSGDYYIKGVRRELNKLGLIGQRSETKSVPTDLLFGPASDRISLLQGILDTDGTTVGGRQGKITTSVEFITVSKALADQVKFIVETLGGNASTSVVHNTYTLKGEKLTGQTGYRMVLSLPSGITPFTLQRKASKWIPRSKYEPYRYIESISDTGKLEEATCISVDAADRLYATKGGVLTHNTIQSIAAVVGSKTTGSILIVAPKTAAYVTWPAELQRWLADISPNDPVRILGGRLDKRKRLALVRDIIQWDQSPSADTQRQWIILSPNYLRFRYQLDADGRFIYDEDGEKALDAVGVAIKALLYVEWSAVIVDEAHETLAGATGNIKKQSAQSRGLRLLQIRDGGLRIALSGTPFRGKHENLWGIANWLRPDVYPDSNHSSGNGTLPYWRWVRKHFEVYHDETFDVDVIGNLRSERELAREAKLFMIRRTKKKVLPELPDKFYAGTPLYPNKKPPAEVPSKQHVAWYDKNNPIAVWLPIEGPQKTAYEQMKKEAMAHLEGGTLLANSLLAEMTRLKQFANSLGRLDKDGHFQPQFPSNKFDWLLEWLRERGIYGPEPSGTRVVVASQFTRHINLFAQELQDKYKIPCYVLTGATSAEHRLQYQQEFQSGKTAGNEPSPEVFLMNTKAGGVGITLDAADDLVVVDSTHNPDDQVQLEDRIHRISRVHNVTIWTLASKGTIDQQILRATRKTGRSLKRILDTPQAALELLES